MTSSSIRWLMVSLAAVLLHLGILVFWLSDQEAVGANGNGSGGTTVMLGAAGAEAGSAAGATQSPKAEFSEPVEPAASGQLSEAEAVVPSSVAAQQQARPPVSQQQEPVNQVDVKQGNAANVRAETAVKVSPDARTHDQAKMAVETQESMPVEPEPLSQSAPEVLTVQSGVELNQSEARSAPAESAEEAQSTPIPRPRRPELPRLVESQQKRGTSAPSQVATAGANLTKEASTPTKSSGPGGPGGQASAKAGASSGAGLDSAAGPNEQGAGHGGDPGAQRDYISALRAWLAQHQRYPERARERREQGTVMLYFVMNRNGQILDYHVQKSSGYRLLDREVSALIERAQPLPAIPPEMQQSRLALVVPIQFVLR